MFILNESPNTNAVQVRKKERQKERKKKRKKKREKEGKKRFFLS